LLPRHILSSHGLEVISLDRFQTIELLSESLHTLEDSERLASSVGYYNLSNMIGCANNFNRKRAGGLEVRKQISFHLGCRKCEDIRNSSNPDIDGVSTNAIRVNKLWNLPRSASITQVHLP